MCCINKKIYFCADEIVSFYIQYIYILFLCSMSCTDIHKDERKQIKSELSGDCGNPHEHETCSPFCICFCCGSLGVDIVVLPEIIVSSFEF